jgi:hypothetical protein
MARDAGVARRLAIPRQQHLREAQSVGRGVDVGRADVNGVDALLGQNPAVGGKAGGKYVAVGISLDLVHIAARYIGGPRGHAEGRGAVVALVDRAHPGEPFHVRRAHHRMPVNRADERVMLVGLEHDHVQARRRGGALPGLSDRHASGYRSRTRNELSPAHPVHYRLPVVCPVYGTAPAWSKNSCVIVAALQAESTSSFLPAHRTSPKPTAVNESGRH